MAATDDIVEIRIATERKNTSAEKEEAVSSVAKRIHHSFPTFAETTANREIAYSDHLPQFSRVPLTADPNGPTLNLLSYNTLGRDLSMSGIHTGLGNEADEQITRRYARIVDGLVLGKDNHDLDCILLQETEVDIMLPILKEKLGDKNWQFQVSDHGLITCHNKTTLTAIRNGESFNRDHRVLSNSFKHKRTGETVVLHNSWGIFSPFPRHREEEYRSLLAPRADDNGKVVRIVMGDTNSRIAPLDDNPRNIVTGAVPMKFHKDKGYSSEQQLGDYPDGGFYTDLQGKIRQLQTVTLDFATGEILPAETDREDLSWVYEYRMVMCLEQSYTTKEIIEDKTLSEYEGELKERCKDDNIQVTMAATSMNDKAIAIRFSRRSELNKVLRDAMAVYEDIQFTFVECQIEMQEFPVMFVPVRLLPKLVAAIEEYLPRQPNHDVTPLLKEIETQIDRLKTSPGFTLFNKPPHTKIEVLELLKKELLAHPMTKYDIRSAARRWENQEYIVLQSGSVEIKTNGEILGEHRNRLRGIFLDETDPTIASEFLARLKAGPR